VSEFLAQNPLYVVLVVVLAVWLGIYLYLFRLDRRVKRLEEQSK
jgi:CcmD family protein